MRPTLRFALEGPCLAVLLCVGCGGRVSSHPNADSSPDGKDNEWMDAGAPSPDGSRDATAIATDTSMPVDGGALGPAARVLLVDRARDVFAAYDHDGRLAHDYRALLDFGTGYDEAWISLAGHMARWTTASDLITDIWWLRKAQGRFEAILASTLLLAAKETGGKRNRLKLASMAGEVLATFDLDGDFDGYALSPQGRNLVATKYGSTAIIVRLSDGKELWRGESGSGAAAFSPDDKHLIAAWSPQIPFQLVDLESGRIIEPAPAALPFPDNARVSVQAALDTGAVITAEYGYAETITKQLWWVDWDGNLSPFDGSLPQQAFEDFVRWDAAGKKALWIRRSSTTSPDVPLGYFVFDVSSRQMQAWEDVGQAQKLDSTDCFDGRFTTFFGVVEGSLLACGCDSGACHQVAALPASEPEWKPYVMVSEDRSIVAVYYVWQLSSRQPDRGGATQIFRSTGEKLTTAELGWLKLDQSTTLATVSNSVANPANTGVMNLATGQISWLGAAKFEAIAYE